MFEWGNPPHDGHPGKAINCRCTAEPVWDDEDVEDAPKAEASDLVFGATEVTRQGARPTPGEGKASQVRSSRVDVHRNRQGGLTDGVYRVSPHGARRHAHGHAPAGKSAFGAEVDAEAIALEAAKIGDENGLWRGNKAVVAVDRVIGVDVYTGKSARYVLVYQEKSGSIHAHPHPPPTGRHMRDMTNQLEQAVESVQHGLEWGYSHAKDIAVRLSSLMQSADVEGSPSENWLRVFVGDEVVAYIYQLAPFVIADDSFEPLVSQDFEEVSFYFGIAEDEETYRIDPAKAAKLMPYPLDELDLNFEAFEITDFLYETAS